ncbi:MAG: SAM-dependent methyltransferase [Clostridiales bacterium]|nr:SAM-dependent methyltransferase [Clostridiales bacterium]
MRIADRWKDYELIDASDGERLERWGDILLIRPDPQIIWQTPRRHPLWKQANARYHRSSSGGGQWERLRPMPEVWQISYGRLRFHLKPMGFKHTGLFPEQAVNWDRMAELIRREAGRRPVDRPVRVLNLFGYTGGATLACVEAGAHVTHVDASRGMVAWGRENVSLSGLAERPMRWLVDDCGKFVQRELRRGNTYDALLMDPPSYGRGPGGEVWKLEEQIYPLLTQCAGLLSRRPLFFLVNSYTTGLSPSVMKYMLSVLLPKERGGVVSADEIGLPVKESGEVLPCGATALWEAKDAGRPRPSERIG